MIYVNFVQVKAVMLDIMCIPCLVFTDDCYKLRKYLVLTIQVFDCWFESGSMPYAYIHYPFENRKLFEKNFPGDFIAEGLDQTRGWSVLSPDLLFNSCSFLISLDGSTLYLFSEFVLSVDS